MNKKIYTKQEINLFIKLNSPKKIQDYLNGLKFNFEKNGETCKSARFVIKTKSAHCMEGAMFAAAALEFNGHKPLIMDLRSVKHDFDHVVAVFKQFGYFGAISKTNHAVLRYREPVYKSIRELALSYFHEYFLNNGKKTLREYSDVFDLRYFDKSARLHPHPRRRQGYGGQAVPLPLVRFNTRRGEGVKFSNWRTSEKQLFDIPHYLDKIKHYKILSLAQSKNLRLADEIEIKAGKLVEWKK
ncbi:MAG TPA: hypothetical protein VE973_03220 [Candidatus Limnocylindria bacterium]|nr:hypothetical protein [Candidatus Limnocylindria bacterium]